jgi:hypothetical protein
MQSVILSVADIRVKVCSAVSGVIERFREMYKAFRVAGEDFDACLEIQCLDLTPFIRYDALPFERTQHCITSNYLYAAAYDPEERKAVLLTNLENTYAFAEEYFLKLFSYLCLTHGKLLFHCATLYDRDNNAYVFYGPSGIGKSTLVRNSPHLRVLSDDIVVMQQLEAAQFKIYKTPLERNKQRGQEDNVFCLKGFYRLNQAPANELKPLNAAEHLSKLMGNLWNLDFSQEGYKHALQLVNREYSQVPGYDLFLTNSNEFWKLLA